MQKKIKALILVLGLLQVVGTVKNKGTHFNTGPTTVSRHSKTDELEKPGVRINQFGLYLVSTLL